MLLCFENPPLVHNNATIHPAYPEFSLAQNGEEVLTEIFAHRHRESLIHFMHM